jgi:hypothetical protein
MRNLDVAVMVFLVLEAITEQEETHPGGYDRAGPSSSRSA